MATQSSVKQQSNMVNDLFAGNEYLYRNQPGELNPPSKRWQLPYS